MQGLSVTAQTGIPSWDGEEEYLPAQFANRASEKELTQRKIREAQTGPILRPLLEFYGVIGIGKTWLLEHLREVYRYGSEASRSLARPTLTAMVDLGSYSTLAQYYFLLQRLVNQLLEQLGKEAASYASDGQYFQRERALSLRQRTEAAGIFAELINKLAERSTPILIFDTTEQADEKLLDWLEEEIIYPTIRTDRVVYIFSGRRPLRWKKFEVRRRVEPHEVCPFGRGMMIEQFRPLAAEAIAAPIYDYSFGHPLASREIFKTLQELSRQQGLTLDTGRVKDWEEDIRLTVDNRVIEYRFLRDVPERLKPLLRTICVLRQFNANPLRRFASEFLQTDEAGEAYADKPGIFYLDVIRDMVDTTLVYWSKAYGGYVLDPVVRKIMAKNLLMRDKAAYIARHSLAQSIYDGWIEQYPRNSGGFLIERTYHLACLLQAKGIDKASIDQQIVDEFQGILSNKLRLNPDIAWDLPDIAAALAEELKEDDELKERISEETYQRLKEQAERFREKVGAPS